LFYFLAETSSVNQKIPFPLIHITVH
jgi:hypothetical protein